MTKESIFRLRNCRKRSILFIFRKTDESIMSYFISFKCTISRSSYQLLFYYNWATSLWIKKYFSWKKDIGVIFLQSLDQMESYRIVNDIKQFIRDYGLIIGGGGITKEMNSRKGTKLDGYIILKIFWNEYYWFLFCYRSSI